MPFQWTKDCHRAFQELKNHLIQAPILAHYDPKRATKLETDASDGVVGAVLSQKLEDGEWHPIAYFSKTMQPAECNYPIHDKEMLAIIRALEEWRPELEGLRANEGFQIYTDHKALEYFMTKRALSSRQANWAEFLSRFLFTIQYQSGKQNVLADILSRQQGMVEEQNTVKQMLREQTLLPSERLDTRIINELEREEAVRAEINCLTATATPPRPQDMMGLDGVTLLNRLFQANKTHESLQEHRATISEDDSPWTLEDDLLLYKGRLAVPDDGDLRARLLDEIHRQKSSAHPGINKMKKITRARYYWPKMTEDIERYCRRVRSPRDLPPGLLQPLPIPERPWQHISVDYCSFPKDKAGYDNILVVVDRFGKRAISIPCYKTTTAREMAQLFLIHVYRHQGPPDSIVSDRGPQFVSEFWEAVCQILGTKLKLSTADHAQTDGQTENANQYIEQRIRPFVNYYQDNWSELLPMVDFASAALPQASTGVPPFLVDRGYYPRTSFDWKPLAKKPTTSVTKNQQYAKEWTKRLEEVWEFVKGSLVKAQDSQRKQANKKRREVDFQVGDQAYVRTDSWKSDRPSRKLDHRMAGPFLILEKVGNSYRLDLPSGIKVHPVFSPDKLRKAGTDPLPGQIADEAPAIEVNGEQQWEVEQILGVKQVRNRLRYRAAWIGHDEDLTYYPAGDFKDAPHKIRDFHQQYPEQPGPPRRLATWLKAWEEDTYLEDHPEDDLPEEKSTNSATKQGRRRKK
jgi:transposase InsO family protein